MVQHKEIDIKHLTNDETINESKNLTNGCHLRSYSEQEEDETDDYLEHLLVIPADNEHAIHYNSSVVSKSFQELFTTLEQRKDYPRIKRELFYNYVPAETKPELKEVTAYDEPIVNGVAESLKSIESETETLIEVKEEIPVTRKLTVAIKRAKLVPEHEPSINDEFMVCRRCIIFFKARRFRKIHNMMNHRRKNRLLAKPPELKVKKIKPPPAIKEPLVCDICAKAVKLKSLLRSHMISHLSEKLHQCSLCPYASKRSNDLKKHYHAHHDPDREKKVRTRKRTCDQCAEVLENKVALKLHKKRIHPIDKSVKCQTCNRIFKTNSRIKKHHARFAALGTDCHSYYHQNNLGCDHCSSKFSLKSGLLSHIKSHLLKFACSQCKMSFKTSFSLKYHEFSHQDIEPKCFNCSQVFKSLQHFSNHLKKKSCLTNGHCAHENEPH